MFILSKNFEYQTNKEDNDNFYFEEKSENLSEEDKTLLTLHINRKEKAK